MAPPRPRVFKQESIRYIRSYQAAINNAANAMGVPASAVAAAIAEEHHSSLSRTGLARAGDQFLDWRATDHGQTSAYAGVYNSFYQSAQSKLNADPLYTPDPYGMDKLFNPMWADLGRGNIKLITAVNLLKEYETSHPSDDKQ